MDKNYGDRTIKCRRCNKQTWLTAGTFFHRIRSARPWLAAIWFMERGVILTSRQLHKLSGIAQSSALHIFQKISRVLQQAMQNEATLTSSLFSKSFCRRSRITPGGKHPREEEEENELQANNNIDNSAIQTINIPQEYKFAGAEQEIYAQLSAEPITFDLLSIKTGIKVSALSAALTMLELAGEVTVLSGNRYIRSAAKLKTTKENLQTGHDLSAEIKERVSTVITFIQNTFGGISRKYLQNYLAAFWYQQNNSSKGIRSLLRLCFQFGPLSYKTLLEYVTPALVKVP
ncbi:MAG: hypothetical protein K2W82_07405 [Candidatus Obscuribacterales bacterium]|nr:hypothetical protein [Candidatus Obscuribacterales bacterium]